MSNIFSYVLYSCLIDKDIKDISLTVRRNEQSSSPPSPSAMMMKLIKSQLVSDLFFHSYTNYPLIFFVILCFLFTFVIEICKIISKMVTKSCIKYNIFPLAQTSKNKKLRTIILCFLKSKWATDRVHQRQNRFTQ